MNSENISTHMIYISFKLTAHMRAVLAQLEERQTSNLEVMSSSLIVGTFYTFKAKNEILKKWSLFTRLFTIVVVCVALI